MLRIGPRVALASATLLSLLGVAGGTARADRFLETVYVEPVSYYVPTGYVATSRVVPTTYSYAIPTSFTYAAPRTTSYVLPTTYTTTAYSSVSPTYAVTPTTYYYPTTYRRGLLSRMFSRPVIETTRSYAYDVTPTTYYLPTTISLDTPVVNTAYSLACNETNVPFTPPAPVAAATTPNSTSQNVVRSAPKTQEQPLYSEELPNPRNKVTSTPAPSAASAAAAPAPAGISDPTPPARPLDVPKPVAPADDLTVPPVVSPPDLIDGQSTSMRPKVTDLRPQIGSASPNMLRGEVVSGLTGSAVAGMEVVFSDPNRLFQDRKRLTNEKGAFEVFLPTGDWVIHVVDPAGKAKPLEYGTVTSTNGRYLDSSDLPIYALRISN